MLLSEGPSEGPLIIREHPTDALVVHFLVVQFGLQEFVLFADFLFVAHTVVTPTGLMNVRYPADFGAAPTPGDRNVQPTADGDPIMDVHVIATGGTIASTADGDERGAAPELSGDELVETVPELETHANVTVETVADRPGFDMSPAVCARLAERIREIGTDVDGTVVTHGTDTLAETARYLDLTCETPVVVTGAQRRPDEQGSDGPANLVTAVRAAAHERVGQGAFVAFDEELHAAATARKAHTCALDTFRSPEAGAIARFTRERVHWYRRPKGSSTTVPVPDPGRHPTVPIVVSASGIGRDAFEDAEARADGIVVAGTGLGNATTALGEEIAEASCPVVVTSRCHAGPSEPVYGTAGGAAALAAHDHVRFAHGTPWATRIELMLALAAECVEDRFEALDT